MAFKIQVVTAFVAIDKDGNEGVMGANLDGKTFFPLICADEERIQQMFPIAEDIKAKAGMDYKVIQFSIRTDITEETINKYK